MSCAVTYRASRRCQAGPSSRLVGRDFATFRTPVAPLAISRCRGCRDVAPVFDFAGPLGRVKAPLPTVAAGAALTRPARSRFVGYYRSDGESAARGFIVRLPYTGLVKIWLDLPDDMVERLTEKGQDLSRAALEALAIDAYRMNRITGYQLCQFLEIPSRYELDGFLKLHGVPLEYTIEDFEREGATSARLWKKRQDELATGRDGERRPE